MIEREGNVVVGGMRQLFQFQHAITVEKRRILRVNKKVYGLRIRMWDFVTHIWIWMPKFCPNVQKCFYAIVREKGTCSVQTKAETVSSGQWKYRETHAGSQSSTAAVV